MRMGKTEYGTTPLAYATRPASAFLIEGTGRRTKSTGSLAFLGFSFHVQIYFTTGPAIFTVASIHNSKSPAQFWKSVESRFKCMRNRYNACPSMVDLNCLLGES